MAKKATAKKLERFVNEDSLEDDISTVLIPDKNIINSLEDDDPFSSGVSGAVTPVRAEPEDELNIGGPTQSLDNEPDDFGQGFLERDGKIMEEIKSSTSTAHIQEEAFTELEDLKEENSRLKKELELLKNKYDTLPQLNPSTISDKFDDLYQTLKEGRAIELLAAVQKDYLDLKYNSYTEKEKKEIQSVLKDALRERFEGKIKAAKLIHKQDEKGK